MAAKIHTRFCASQSVNTTTKLFNYDDRRKILRECIIHRQRTLLIALYNGSARCVAGEGADNIKYSECTRLH